MVLWVNFNMDKFEQIVLELAALVRIYWGLFLQKKTELIPILVNENQDYFLFV